ncbi:rcc01693 family protein [Roseinatronobacter monicus]|uniref:Putative phage protein (TIGR02216 family) n=1 Tax=Roseinatronobacter monicus TaxID=393481 RepID=A0A543KGT9_9RHOB|nr:rcc01693 family protein [Roseinatronobacter monicus]TQM94290.1 putative phage protein (TIGR02216 family) [Roseinatronobacter monicus]
MSALDWPALMRLGLRELRLTPRDFWALTPVELMIMAGLEGAPGPLTRARLNELAARYPDTVKGTQNDQSQRS